MKSRKSILRSGRRQFEREHAKILKEFAIVVEQFEEALFSFDWDASEELQKFPIFEKFNAIWIEFCDRWNKDKDHIALALGSSFYEYAIEQTLKIDTTTTTDRQHNDRNLVSNEEKNTGDKEGRPEG